jgi:hypothetical protein
MFDRDLAISSVTPMTPAIREGLVLRLELSHFSVQSCGPPELSPDQYCRDRPGGGKIERMAREGEKYQLTSAGRLK